MSSTKIILGLFLLAVVAACAPKPEEVVYVDQPAVSQEPTDTGKYK